MSALSDLMPIWLLMWAVGAALFGGFVKGAIGFALPLVMVSLMGFFMEPQLIMAGLVLSLVITNVFQALRYGWGETASAIRDFWPFIVIVCGVILISAQLLTRISAPTLYIMLGTLVVVLCVIQLVGLRLVIPPRWRGAFGVVAGAVAGFIGGLSGTWGAPTVLYLLAMETPKARQMVVQGVIYGLGAVSLLAGHLYSGVLNAQTWVFSAFLIVPSLIGMWLGFKLGDRLDQERFRMVTLIVLTVAGLNLIRRGIMG